MQEQLVSVPESTASLTLSWYRCKFLQIFHLELHDGSFFVKYTTVAVTFLTAHASSQGLGQLQQAVIGGHMLLGYRSAPKSAATGV